MRRSISFIPEVSLYYNRYRKASLTKDAVIELRIYYQTRVKFISTRIRVFKNEWRNGRIVNRGDAVQLNKQLDKIVADVRQVVYEMYEEGRIELDAIPSRLLAKRKPALTLMDFCRRRAEIRKHGIAKDSKERYDRFLTFLEGYSPIKTFYDLSESKIVALDKHLMEKGLKAKSRWSNYHRFLKSFILDAVREGLLPKNPYDSLKMDHGDDRDGIDKFLYPKEFAKLRAAEMSCERLEKVRDLFVFQTLTCLSYVDLADFKMDKVKESHLTQVLAGKRGKTNIDYLVPLLPGAVEILKKYKGLPSFQRHRVISNQKYNTYLKEVMQEAGIDRPVTSHWARHTGATLLLNNDVPVEVVSKVCGHSSIKMTERIYAKLLGDTIIDKVMAVADRL